MTSCKSSRRWPPRFPKKIDLWRNDYIPAVKDAGDWINEHLIPDFLGLNDVIGHDREELEAQADAMDRVAEVTGTHAENLSGYKAAQAGATAAAGSVHHGHRGSGGGVGVGR